MASNLRVALQAVNKSAARPLLQRIAAFLMICLLYSGLLGPHIISSEALYRGHFDIYGGLGKALLFGVVALVLLVRHRGYSLPLPAWRQVNGLWLGLSLLTFVAGWWVVDQIIRGSSGWHVVGAHMLLITSIISAGLGCMDLTASRLLYKTFRRQLILSLAMAAVFYLFLLAVYAAWRPLATIVLHSVHWLFTLVGIHSEIILPRSLLFDKFGIEIAQYCSGIESIALFTGLYTIVAILDWDKLNHRKLTAVFMPALMVLFACNILRVFVLIAAGYYINPHIAFSLFHTYAGMVFFIIYSGIFWSVAYKWLLVKHRAHQ